MKTVKVFLTGMSLWINSLSLSAQILVFAHKIDRDTLLATVPRNSLSSKTLYASGVAEFSTQSGYVRILLSDEYGYDMLIYESLPLFATNGIDSFSNSAEETIDIFCRYSG